jgi:hypothetical protein
MGGRKQTRTRTNGSDDQKTFAKLPLRVQFSNPIIAGSPPRQAKGRKRGLPSPVAPLVKLLGIHLWICQYKKK